MTEKILRSPCNLCGRDTEHDVIHTEVRSKEIESTEMLDRTEVLSCRGCKEVSVRNVIFEVSVQEEREEPLSQITYTPPRLWHQQPKCLSDLEQYDPDLKSLLDEVYSATHDKQMRLLSMGVRSVLDRMMSLALGSGAKGFKEKLSSMIKEGHLTKKQDDNMEIVIDAGSASTHRGFKPPRELLEEMVIVMEGLVRDHYITGPMLHTARVKIPPRPQNQLKVKLDP